MKRIFSPLAILLCLTILLQSIPIYAVAATVGADGEALGDPVFSEIIEGTAKTTSEPYILGEVTEERTLSTKVFRMSDGSYTAAVYPTQIHYEDNGELKEIDYRFKEVTVNGESFFETTEGPVFLRVPETIGENSPVTFGSGENSIFFSLSAIDDIEAETLEASIDTERLESLRETVFAEVLSDDTFEELYSKEKSEAQILDIELSDAISEITDIMLSAPGAASAVRYGSVMNGIDLNYSISGSVLKEEIVLNRQASALKTFSFTHDAGELTPVLNADRSVSLNDAEGKEQLRIASPFMFDAIGAESTSIEVTLTENEDGT